MDYRLREISWSAPTITASTIATHLRLPAEDAYASALLPAAARLARDLCGRETGSGVYELAFQKWPSTEAPTRSLIIAVPYPPVASIVSISIDGTAVSSSAYAIHDAEHGLIVLDEMDDPEHEIAVRYSTTAATGTDRLVLLALGSLFAAREGHVEDIVSPNTALAALARLNRHMYYGPEVAAW